MALRPLPAILGDVLRQGRCPEVSVQCTCGHERSAEIQLAAFIQDKRDARSAARALRSACRRDAVPAGDAGTVLVSAPADACPSCGRGSSSSLWCGGVAMDLPAAGQTPEGVVPVGIGARQFLEWLETEPNGSGSLKIQLSAGSSADEASWRSLFTTVGGRILLCSIVWVLACLACALLVAPEWVAERPEQLYQQVQDQIRSIPLPIGSPHYAFYRRHYLEQYQQMLRGMRELEGSWALEGRPRLNAPLFLRGLALGTWLLIVSLAICEYRFCTLSIWIELLAEWRPKFARPAWLQLSHDDDDAWVDGEEPGRSAVAAGSGGEAAAGRRPPASPAKPAAPPAERRQRRRPCAKAPPAQPAATDAAARREREEPKKAASAAVDRQAEECHCYSTSLQEEPANTIEWPVSAGLAAATEVPAPDAPAATEEALADASFDGDGMQEPQPGGVESEAESNEPIHTPVTPRAVDDEHGAPGQTTSPGELCDAISMAAAVEAPPPPQTFVWGDCKSDGVKCSRTGSMEATEVGDTSGEPSLAGSEDAFAHGLDAAPGLEAAPGLGTAPGLTAAPGLNACHGLKAASGLSAIPGFLAAPGLDAAPGLGAAPGGADAGAGGAKAAAVAGSVEVGGEGCCSSSLPSRPVPCVGHPPPGLEDVPLAHRGGGARELPTDLDALSTDELIHLFFDAQVRTELQRRGVPLRRQLLRCLRMVKEEREAAAEEPPGDDGSGGGRASGSTLRADAPEFTPASAELPAPAAATPSPELLLQGTPYEGLVQALLQGLALSEASDVDEVDAAMSDPCWELAEHFYHGHCRAAAKAKWYAAQLQAEAP